MFVTNFNENSTRLRTFRLVCFSDARQLDELRVAVGNCGWLSRGWFVFLVLDARFGEGWVFEVKVF